MWNMFKLFLSWLKSSLNKRKQMTYVNGVIGQENKVCTS